MPVRQRPDQEPEVASCCQPTAARADGHTYFTAKQPRGASHGTPSLIASWLGSSGGSAAGRGRGRGKAPAKEPAVRGRRQGQSEKVFKHCLASCLAASKHQSEKVFKHLNTSWSMCSNTVLEQCLNVKASTLPRCRWLLC